MPAKKPPKKRSSAAKALAKAAFKQRIVPSGKAYKRKPARSRTGQTVH